VRLARTSKQVVLYRAPRQSSERRLPQKLLGASGHQGLHLSPLPQQQAS